MFSKTIKIFTLASLFLNLTSGIAFAASLAPDVNAIDTIAGFGTTLETSKTLPNKKVNFILDTPLGDNVVYSSYTDSHGIALFDVEGQDLTKAGVYHVYSQLGSQPGNESSFTVYPDEVSSETSLAMTSGRTVSLEDTVLLTVKLKDKYANAIKGHQVTVISSRENDEITFASSKSYTNSQGEILFDLASDEPGVSIYSIFDVTSGKILESRPKIYFDTDYQRLSSAGGDADALVAQATTEPYLAIEDVPETLEPNENVSFTVTAYDADGEIMTDYLGTIHVSAPGENGNMVEVPAADYVFTEDDMGTHTYSLGLKFLSEGTYLVEARDTDNFSLYGELEIAVGSGETPSASQQISENYEFTLDSPASGTYGSSLQTLGGKAPPGYAIGFYDNDEEFGITEADELGKYSFETTPLSTGSHSFVAVLLDADSEVISESDPLVLVIDSSAATVDQFIVTPETDVPVGSAVTVNVHSEADLQSVKVLTGGQTFELQASPTSSTLYIGTIQAPATSGAYDMAVTLVDNLGNEATYDAQGRITVIDALHPAAGPLSAVVGLTAIPSNNKVTLTWAPVETTVGIKNYRVYYGILPDRLTNAVDTFNSSTTWYISSLPNDMKHYFAVTAIDNLGNESATMGVVVESTPFITETFQGLDPVDPAPQGQYYYPYMPAQTGPEALWVLLASVFLSFSYFGLKKNGFLK
jgi:hypothetical protein